MLQELLNRDDDLPVGDPVQRRDTPAAARLDRAGRLRPTSNSTLRRSSTESCSPTSSCSTWPATQSRFARQGDGGPETCYLEQWRGFAVEQGQRALDQLRDGVQRAISILGTGFLSHPDNPQLRGRLDPRNADLKLDDFNRALLRLVYRMLFWFVAEDRGALLQPDPADAEADARARLREARDRYAAYFSSARLRQLGRRHRGGRHGDLFEAVRLVFDALGTEGGVPELALPGIGGIFESRRDDGRPLPLDEPLDGARLMQRGAAQCGARAVPVTPARRRRLAPGGFRQPGCRGTRQRLRVAAGVDPPLRRRTTDLHAGDAGRQRAERVRLLLHAHIAGRMPAGLRARSRCWTKRAPTGPPRNGSRRCWT